MPDPVIPAVETPVAAPVIPVVAPVAAVQAPVVETVVTPAPVVEAAPVAPVEAVIEAPKPAETVLAAELDKTAPKAEVKPEIKAVEPVAPAEVTEGGQSDEPAPPPMYDAFVIPEDVKLDTGRIGEFTNLLSELEVKGKAEHTLVQEFGQKALDFHINEVRTTLENVNKYQLKAWEDQKTAWKDQFLADPEIGGNRFQTTVDSALTFIRTHGGTQEQQAEFRNLMETSGLGNHPAMIRLLAKAGAAMSEGTPLAAKQPAAAPKSKTQTLYGKAS